MGCSVPPNALWHLGGETRPAPPGREQLAQAGLETHAFMCFNLIKLWVNHGVTYEDFLGELNKAGLSVKRFADLIGMQPNSVSNNKKKGEVPVHLALIASLLAEMATRQIDYEPVMARVQPLKKRPRGAAVQGRFAGDKQTTLGFANE